MNNSNFPKNVAKVAIDYEKELSLGIMVTQALGVELQIFGYKDKSYEMMEVTSTDDIKFFVADNPNCTFCLSIDYRGKKGDLEFQHKGFHEVVEYNGGNEKAVIDFDDVHNIDGSITLFIADYTQNLALIACFGTYIGTSYGKTVGELVDEFHHHVRPIQ